MMNEKEKGITVESCPKKQVNKRQKLDYAVPYLLAVLLLIGLGGSLLSLTELSVYGIVLAVWGCLSVVVCFFYQLRPKRRLLILFLGLLAVAALAVFTSTLFWDGMAVTVNSVYALVGCAVKRIFLPLSVSGAYSDVFAATIFCLPLTAVLAVVSCYLVWSGKGGSLGFLLILFAAAVIFLDTSPDWLWYGLLFAAVALLSLRQLMAADFGAGRSKAFLFSGGAVLGIAAVIAAIVFFAAAAGGYEKPAIAEALEKSAESTIENVRYGTNEKVNLPDGDFTKATFKKVNKEGVLQVTMTRPEAMYLRGFVGSTYTGSGWQETDKRSLFENASLFYWLHQDGFYGQSQLSAAAAAAGQTSAEQNEVTIKNLKAKTKYIYTPYEYITEPKDDTVYHLGDEAPDLRDFDDAEEYTFFTMENMVRSPSDLAAALNAKAMAGEKEAETYLRDEGSYRQYAYEQFLTVPQELSTVFRTRFGEISSTEEHAPYDEVMQKILDELLNHTSYNQDVATLPEDTDFVSYFLDQTAEGYDVHYATAAAMIFRYFGIPARYVEGYIVTPDDVNGISSGDTITLTGKNAHAWVEYYRDGIGWLPLEVTPPYLFTMPQPDSVSALISDTYDAESDQQGMSEMTEDNYEDLQPEENKTENDTDRFTLGQWLLLIFGSIALLLFLAVVILAVLRRRRLTGLKKALAAADGQTAVNMVFEDILKLLYAAGLTKENGSLEQYNEALTDLCGAPLSRRFAMLTALHRETIFSDHAISAQRLNVFILFRKEVKAALISGSSFRKRWLDKYIRHLY